MSSSRATTIIYSLLEIEQYYEKTSANHTINTRKSNRDEASTGASAIRVAKSNTVLVRHSNVCCVRWRQSTGQANHNLSPNVATTIMRQPIAEHAWTTAIRSTILVRTQRTDCNAIYGTLDFLVGHIFLYLRHELISPSANIVLIGHFRRSIGQVCVRWSRTTPHDWW